MPIISYRPRAGILISSGFHECPQPETEEGRGKGGPCIAFAHLLSVCTSTCPPAFHQMTRLHVAVVALRTTPTYLILQRRVLRPSARKFAYRRVVAIVASCYAHASLRHSMDRRPRPTAEPDNMQDLLWACPYASRHLRHHLGLLLGTKGRARERDRQV